MNRIYLLMIVSVVAIGGMLYMLSQTDSQLELGDQPITVFCAASNQAVMEAIRADYEQEFDREVHVTYGSSQQLLSQIEVSKAGELYLPADDSYLSLAQEKGLIEEILPIARQQAVIAIKKGNPKSIQKLDDLRRSDVRLVQANPDATAIGKVTKQILSEIDAWDVIDEATTSYQGTVTEVANAIKLGSADAGFVYDAVLHTYPELEFIEIPELETGASPIAVGVIASTKRSQAALHFARYVSAIDRGLKRYKEFGFRVSGGDQWKDPLEINLFAGSMLRPAIDETIAEFEQREGIRVNRVYNGCGLLVGQMRATEGAQARPDAFFACDSEFMDQVADLFPDPVPVSQNELAIVVKKGNPKNITSLRDLSQPGVNVGIGHENECAMGWITQNTLRDGGVQKEVMANVTVQSATGDFLVNKLKTGSLDAVVVYLSNAAGSEDELEAYQIQDIPCSIATQPWAVGAQSKHASTAGRLFKRIISADSQASFAELGFRWQLEQE